MKDKRIVAVDPGPDASAALVYDGRRVLEAVQLSNGDLRRRLIGREFGGPGVLLVLEQVEHFGMPVGREVFQTVFWSGRFAEAAGEDEFRCVTRREVKLHLCNSMRAKDPNIRTALMDRFGGAKAVGTKRDPGPLYGVSGHTWAALAVAVTWWDVSTRPQRA